MCLIFVFCNDSISSISSSAKILKAPDTARRHWEIIIIAGSQSPPTQKIPKGTVQNKKENQWRKKTRYIKGGMGFRQKKLVRFDFLCNQPLGSWPLEVLGTIIEPSQTWSSSFLAHIHCPLQLDSGFWIPSQSYCRQRERLWCVLHDWQKHSREISPRQWDR